MQRLIRSCILMAVLSVLSVGIAFGQTPKVQVSGKLAPGDVRVFVKDTIYEINRAYVVGGTLIIEPGTQIEFTPNGRLIDSTGGRIIADGFAQATYTANPELLNGSNLNPIATAGSSPNPFRGLLPPYAGHSDLAYFLHGNNGNTSSGTISTVDFSGTTAELTINKDKRNFVFNVVLDTVNRKLKQLDVDGAGNALGLIPNQDVVVTYEQAMMFITSRMNVNPGTDPNLKQFPWKRIGNKSPNITQGKIRFIGQPVNNFSYEWGHIVILPGARAAFFRNCEFEGFKKDTTVDRTPYYIESGSPFDWTTVNNNIKKLTNGSGGVITTFSSRTWILNSKFANNRARFKGGAIQFLQAPAGYPNSVFANLEDLKNNVGVYNFSKNPNINNVNGTISDINSYNPGIGVTPGIPRIDMLDEDPNFYTENLSDEARMAWDDARLSVYLGRFRNNSFENNEVVLANVGLIKIGNQNVVSDLDEASYPYGNGMYGNQAFGGAIYMAGNDGDENRRIEVGFGVNTSINVDLNGDGTYQPNEKLSLGNDTFVATNNRAENRQKAGQSVGAKGGAIYLGNYTSLIVSGYFNSNETNAPYFLKLGAGLSPAEYSQGGAIYSQNTFNRLQVRGGANRDNYNNATEFSNNSAGAGGAIYVDGNSDRTMSPIIGGDDATLNTRDYGYNVLFQNNSAITYGGAILAKRNARFYGAGGVDNNQLLGYGGKFSLRFWNNTSGLAGGALHLDIPEGSGLLENEKNILVRRASFRENIVGEGITGTVKTDIRGGGAIYAKIANMNVVQGTEFVNNTVYNGNGAAIAQISPSVSLGANASNKMFITDVDVVNYNNGVGTDYVSTNGVFTWDPTVTYPADTRMLTRFIGNETFVDQDIMESQNGTGTTQQEAGTVKPTNIFRAIDLFNDDWGFAVGSLGTIYKIDEDGTKWTKLNSGIAQKLNDVDVINANLAIAVGDAGKIIKTTNGGATWVTKPTAYSRNINAVQFLGVNVGYAVGQDGGFLTTVDGGETWNNVNIQPGVELNDVVFVSSLVGYAVGDNATILKTVDGGATWSYQVSTINQNLNTVAFSSATRGYVAGNSGAYAWTNDGGANWNEVSPRITTNNINKLVVAANQVLYAIGNGATILKSDDQGSTWNTLVSNADLSNGLYGMSFRNGDLGYVVGDNGFIEYTENGKDFTEAAPADQGYKDVVRIHKGTNLPENGVGLGGALYILDEASQSFVGRADSVQFNRVRIQNNTAYSGAGIYSDNFDYKLVFNRSLVTGNTATSGVGANQNLITGPVEKDAQAKIEGNFASSDLAGAILYGEVQGPLPSRIFSEAANSMYDNNARFLIRLPDAPDTKGVLAGTTGIGFGGTDTLRGNYWGKTEANIVVDVENLIVNNQQYNFPNVSRETFFVAGDGNTWLNFMNSYQTGDDLREQGPFESLNNYSYTPIPLRNGADENTSSSISIPEKLLFSGHIYDVFDKGTDIKSADYSKRRMSPIEDFAIGIAPKLVTFTDSKLPSNGKVVKRWVRNPFNAEDPKFGFFDKLQQEYARNSNGGFYHPIGQPIFLESEVDYDGIVERSNHDPLVKNESVFFVINETTGDYIRVNLEQVSEDAPNRELFRGRVELVPDSTNRAGNTLLRRTAEGLENYGSNLGGVTSLLDNLYRNAYKEDGATLLGRKYSQVKGMFGGVGSSIFSNRPDLPTENNGRATFFAGERYRALAVRVNDTVRVVSRTTLWKEGINSAFAKGAEFVITAGIEKPQWTGDIIRLQTTPVVEIRPNTDPIKNKNGVMDTLIINELFNTVWVSEDRYYPVENGTYSNLTGYENGTDSILAITAVDSNGYNDPRAIFPFSSNSFTYLDYSWNVASNTALKNWLMVDSVYAGDNNSTKDGAIGHYVFKGRPINPYVVPGGETVNVTVKSYPPTVRTLDSLKKTFGWANDNDTLASLIELYDDYFHAQTYDAANARFLQQDTIDFSGSNLPSFTNTYAFKIFVTDSIPKFLPWGASSETITRNYKNGDVHDTVVVYDGSIAACNPIQINNQDYLVANLTDKLRFQVDINTDDELEDAWAKKVHNWDFKYGKTSYGFLNQHITGDGDVIVIDTAYYVDPNTNNVDVVLSQTRPSWMASNYIYQYGKDGVDASEKDLLGSDLTNSGKLNIRIPRVEALKILAPTIPQNSYIHADTAFTIVANDGHGGKLAMTYNVKVNVAPEITTQSLPNAKEDVEYNTQLIDTLKQIRVMDKNFEDKHKFELIKAGSYPNGIPKDNCFPEAGNWTLGTDYTDATPEWLFVNEQTGMLYGIPGVKDAPKIGGNKAKVSVLVTDENGLTAVKQFDLQVDSTNHNPYLTATPNVDCWDMDKNYSDTLYVTDIDLGRTEPTFEENLTLEVIEPANGVSVSPSTLTGVKEGKQKIIISSNNLNIPRDADGKATIKVRVTDKAGNEDILTYRIKISDETNFSCELRIENSVGAFNVLEWGTASNNAPTTGDGKDGDLEIGNLDENFCEYELPPLPVSDVFDARWTMPERNGVERTIYPAGQQFPVSSFIYKAEIQPGGENGNTSPMYPLKVTWDKTCIPAINDNTGNPDKSTWYLRDGFSNGQFFNIDMRTGMGWNNTAYTGLETVTIDGDKVTLTITNSTINSIIIFNDIHTSVAANNNLISGINSVSPNPVSNDSKITFTVDKTANVTLDVVDMLGNTVSSVVNNIYNAGTHSVNWNATTDTGMQLTNGAYRVRLTVDGQTSNYPVSVVK